MCRLGLVGKCRRCDAWRLVCQGSLADVGRFWTGQHESRLWAAHEVLSHAVSCLLHLEPLLASLARHGVYQAREMVHAPYPLLVCPPASLSAPCVYVHLYVHLGTCCHCPCTVQVKALEAAAAARHAEEARAQERALRQQRQKEHHTAAAVGATAGPRPEAGAAKGGLRAGHATANC